MGRLIEAKSFRTCAASVDNEARTATDNICRAARSITQSATDLEAYVLKRFPLSPSPEYTEWLDGVVNAKTHDPRSELILDSTIKGDSGVMHHTANSADSYTHRGLFTAEHRISRAQGELLNMLILKTKPECLQIRGPHQSASIG